jgi:hypothetical protein
LTQIAELPSGRGLRPVDGVRLRAERLGQTFAGLPDGVSKHDLVNMVRRTRCEALGIPRSSRQMLLTVLRMCDAKHFKTRGQLTGEYGETIGLIHTASNQTLGDELDIGPNSVRRALAGLAKAGWIAFKDSTTRKRFSVRAGGETVDAFGIDLRPFCARYDELLELSQTCQMENDQRLEFRRLLTQLRNRFSALGACAPLARDLDRVQDAIRFADRARKWSSAGPMADAFYDLDQERMALEDLLLEREQDGFGDGNMMGCPDEIDDLRTASQGIEPSESVPAYGHGGGASIVDGLDLLLEADGADGAPLAPDQEPTAPVRAPGVDQLLKTLPAVLAVHQIGFVAPRAMADPRGLIDGYVRQAERRIGLEKRLVSDFKLVLGDQAYRVAVLISAYKADVDNRSGYLVALVSRARMARHGVSADDFVLDLTKTWFGVYRRAKGTSLH